MFVKRLLGVSFILEKNRNSLMKFHCNHCCQQGSEILKKIISFKIRGISALFKVLDLYTRFTTNWTLLRSPLKLSR